MVETGHVKCGVPVIDIEEKRTSAVLMDYPVCRSAWSMNTGRVY